MLKEKQSQSTGNRGSVGDAPYGHGIEFALYIIYFILSFMEDCIFCKIVRGEIPSFKVYEDANVLAFLDIHPTNPGHTLVVPKIHAENIFEISSESWSQVMETARKLSITIENALDAKGINLMMNNREHAGQVVDHVHVHIVPRFTGDAHRQWSQSSYKDGEAEKILDKIRKGL